MWRFRLKQFLTEREVLIGLVIFGAMNMLADTASDIGWSLCAAIVRIVGLVALLALLSLDFWARRRGSNYPVPLMFTEESNRHQARASFDRFVQAVRLADSVKLLEKLSHIRRDDLLICLDRTNPRSSQDVAVWRAAWEELLKEWDMEVDRKLSREFITSEGRCYHIFPHVVLPLAFALGTSVGLRRPIRLYHYQAERFFSTLALEDDPRIIFQSDVEDELTLEAIPSDLSTLPDAEKLILHLVISDRHGPMLTSHPDHESAANTALVYRFALDPDGDWLPHVQNIVRVAKPLMNRYSQVDVCLICPSVIAFALGMAFSRMSHVTVCHWFDDQQYRPVFPLREIEGRLPFD